VIQTVRNRGGMQTIERLIIEGRVGWSIGGRRSERRSSRPATARIETIGVWKAATASTSRSVMPTAMKPPYGHMSAFPRAICRKAATSGKGQVIGYVGSTGAFDRLARALRDHHQRPLRRSHEGPSLAARAGCSKARCLSGFETEARQARSAPWARAQRRRPASPRTASAAPEQVASSGQQILEVLSAGSLL